jgi:uncharacterized damage-inducible protein DinB
MTEQPTTLLPYYQGWDIYQGQLIEALSPLSPEQLFLRAAPQLRSIGENVAHIISARAGWLHYVLERGDESLVELAKWDEEDQPARSADILVGGLEATWQVLQETLSQWTGADMAVLVRDTDENGEEQIYTRQWVLWHLIEHDLHHGGEFSFTLGMHGLPGIAI